MVKTNHSKSGFSIVELSVVITIISILLSISVAAGSKWLTVHKTQTAEKYVEAIALSLDNFYQEMGYYPCPAAGSKRPGDTDYGKAIASCHTSTCPAGLSCNNDVVIGTIPFSTLGIPITEDPWSNKFLYAVDKKITDRDNSVCVLKGSIIVQGDGNNNITDKAAYVVLSHGSGENGAFRTKKTTAFTCDAGRADQENCTNTRTFRQYNIIADDFTSILQWRILDNTIPPKTRGFQRHRKPHQIPGHVYTYIAGESATAVPAVQVESIVARLTGSIKRLKARTSPSTGQFIMGFYTGNTLRFRYLRSSGDARPEIDKRSNTGLSGRDHLSYIYDENSADFGVFHNGTPVTSWATNTGDLRHFRDFLIVNRRLLTTEGLKGVSFFDRPISHFERDEVESYFANASLDSYECAPLSLSLQEEITLLSVQLKQYCSSPPGFQIEE